MLGKLGNTPNIMGRADSMKLKVWGGRFNDLKK
jgi:hypothetical protein